MTPLLQPNGSFMFAAVIRVCLLPAMMAGCTDHSQTRTAELSENSTHGHQHDHSQGGSGDHSHSHDHSHPHRESAAGGNIVSIGHTHHNDGITHFYAEVLPMEGRRIRFTVMTENDAGKLERMALTVAEIPAIIGVEERESVSQPVVFSAVDDSNSEFAIDVPEDLLAEQSYLVVIPMIKIDGQRQNFSFRVKHPADEQVSADGQSS